MTLVRDILRDHSNVLHSCSTYCSPMLIDDKEMQIQAQLRALQALQDAVEDYDQTIGQFRDLVGSLQGYMPPLYSRYQPSH